MIVFLNLSKFGQQVLNIHLVLHCSIYVINLINLRSLMQGRQQAQCIKSLYQQKFYEPTNNNSHTLISKVISFQQKMERFKINRNYSQRIQQTPSFLVEDENKRFRPTTNFVHNRDKKSRYSGQHSSRGAQGPAIAQLKIILDRNNNNSQMNILTQSIRERNLYSKNENRKKWKLVSNRQSLHSKEQTEYTHGKVTPIDMIYFYQDKESIRSERDKRPAILKSETRKQNEEEFVKTKVMSKRVFIGGRDLSKAAQEQYKNYVQMKKNLQLLVQQQKKKDEDIANNIKKISLQKKRIRRISPKKAASHNHKKDETTKTEPKTHNKQEDFILNYQLDPWSVEPEIC